MPTAIFTDCFSAGGRWRVTRMKIDQIARRRQERSRGWQRRLRPSPAPGQRLGDEGGITLGQVAEGKSNEITAIPELLRTLDFQGCIVTIDAMGCQKEIARRSRRQGRLRARGQGEPAASVQDIERPRWALESDYAGLSQHTTEEKGKHGRKEIRFGFVMTDLHTVRDRELWEGLKSLVCVVRQRTVNGKRAVKRNTM